AEVARFRGAGRHLDAAGHAVQALWLAVVIGLFTTVLLAGFAEPALRLMGADGARLDPALSYTRVRALAAIPVLVVMVGHGLFRGLQDTRTPLVITVVANGVNAVLSWVLIYPAGLGVAGAAWGTVLAQTGAAVAFLVLARRTL